MTYRTVIPGFAAGKYPSTGQLNQMVDNIRALWNQPGLTLRFVDADEELRRITDRQDVSPEWNNVVFQTADSEQMHDFERPTEIRIVEKGIYLVVVNIRWEDGSDALQLGLDSDVLFDFGESTLTADGVAAVAAVAPIIIDNPGPPVEVNGHTDNVGSESFNQTLSEERAQTVADELVSNGVNGSRLIVQGFGETQPVASNDTEEGRALNRRVEIRFQGTASNVADLDGPTRRDVWVEVNGNEYGRAGQGASPPTHQNISFLVALDERDALRVVIRHASNGPLLLSDEGVSCRFGVRRISMLPFEFDFRSL